VRVIKTKVVVLVLFFPLVPVLVLLVELRSRRLPSLFLEAAAAATTTAGETFSRGSTEFSADLPQLFPEE
jgi:hypothetical protein